MVELEKTNTIAKQTVEELASRLSEPAWLLEHRLEAFERYYKTPMPGNRDEGWKRTDLQSLDLASLRTAQIHAAKELDKLPQLPECLKEVCQQYREAAGVLYQSVNEAGFYTLDPDLSKKGVILCDMATAVVKYQDKVKAYIKHAEEADGKFTLLSKALFNCGMFLYVPANLEIDKPFIYALDLDSACKKKKDQSCAGKTSSDQSDQIDASPDSGLAVLPRSLVLAEKFSRFKLVSILGSTENKAQELQKTEAGTGRYNLLSQYLDIFVGAQAKVSYLDFQQQASDTFTVSRSNSYVERDGRYESLTLALGACQTKSDMATILKEAGASSEVLGIVLGAGKEKFSFNTIQEHKAPDTKSEIIFRVALKEHSSSVYEGIVVVDKVAQRTDAYQSNKNLLLDGSATADSIPKLEILADDVKCSHGATVGPVDREQIFYLMSRGVSRQIAEQLIVLGFFRQTLARSPFTDALSWLSHAVARKIHQGKLADIESDFFAESL